MSEYSLENIQRELEKLNQALNPGDQKFDFGKLPEFVNELRISIETLSQRIEELNHTIGLR